jgi:hypothetical protein
MRYHNTRFSLSVKSPKPEKSSQANAANETEEKIQGKKVFLFFLKKKRVAYNE